MENSKSVSKPLKESIDVLPAEPPQSTVFKPISNKISKLLSRFTFLQKLNKKLLIVLMSIFIFGAGATGYVAYQNVQKRDNEPESTASPENFSVIDSPENQDQEQTTNTPTQTQTPVSSTKPTSTQSPQATNKPASSPSCNYDLNSSTGSVKIAVQAQTGYLSTSFYGELKASSGCKVLDGRSTDTQTVYGSLNTKEIIFNSVPPGSYDVKAFVAGSWTNSQSVSVSAGQLATVNYSVAGDPAPTSTPTPKPSCTTPVSIPSSGSSPLAVNLYIGYTGGGSSNDLTNIQWDFTGDGSWDVTIPYGNSHQYTYQNPGSYTLKGRIQNNSGTYSEPCQTTITVN